MIHPAIQAPTPLAFGNLAFCFRKQFGIGRASNQAQHSARSCLPLMVLHCSSSVQYFSVNLQCWNGSCTCCLDSASISVCFAMEPCDCLFAMVTLLQSLFNHLCTVQQNRKVPAGLLAVEHTASASDQSPIFCRLFLLKQSNVFAFPLLLLLLLQTAPHDSTASSFSATTTNLGGGLPC